MMVIIAILCPGLSFLLRGKIISAFFAIILQIVAVLTFVFFGAGFLLWGLLAFWAVYSYNNAQARKRNREMIRAMQSRDYRRY